MFTLLEMKRRNEDVSASDYVNRAEKVILELQKQEGKNYRNFTTSKIRNILSMVNEIYNEVMSDNNEKLSDRIQDKIMHLKVRLIYECGRERIVKKFYNEAGLDEIISNIGDSREKFVSFVRYMEALVAYHLYHGGKE